MAAQRTHTSLTHVPSGLGYHKTLERAALAYDKEARACMEMSSEMRKLFAKAQAAPKPPGTVSWLIFKKLFRPVEVIASRSRA